MLAQPPSPRPGALPGVSGVKPCSCPAGAGPWLPHPGAGVAWWRALGGVEGLGTAVQDSRGGEAGQALVPVFQGQGRAL